MFFKVYNPYCHCFECLGKWWQIKLQNRCRKVVILRENKCEQTKTSFESENKIGDILHKEGLQWKVKEIPLLLSNLVFYSFTF